MPNAIHTQVLVLLCSKGIKISVIYRHIGDWNKEKIGISKFKNIHIGATLDLLYLKENNLKNNGPRTDPCGIPLNAYTVVVYTVVLYSMHAVVVYTSSIKLVWL